MSWRTDKPEPGRLVEVWDWLAVARAVWTGEEWRSEAGVPLRWISHWRACNG